ncbi:transglycosylase domain-containing protein [Hellea balneolensis]|uniref:transglycosylase domain-containing protein n=1 Tax=Hellea balneolensis TaxID=287478 RepID=UPI000403DC24|nr:PBP1A family penicillin-binding protein [Hellea balneolensis]
MIKNMPTFRADIDVANDNKVRKKRNIILSVLAVLCIIGTLGYFQTRYYLLDGMPNLPDKATMWEMNLKPNMTLLDKDGRVIGHRGPLVGEPLKLSDMPDYVSGAFLAIEDERFYEHAGIDQKAILRAVFANTKSGSKAQGGSTLTQQLVKTMILTPEKTYRRKFQEALLARDMEAILSKPEILELYLNRISLGPQIFGVEAAAQRYFGKSARDVSLSEAVILAALPKAPSRYNPVSNFDGAWERGELVLQRMVVNEMISYEQMQTALASPPEIAEDAEPLIAPDTLGYAFDLIYERAHGLIGTNHKDLIVKTTIDVDLQNKAQETISNVVGKFEKSKKVSEGALVSIDNQTGAIRAMVGGRDYSKSKFNRAAQAKRQPGSAFKAFVYAAALEDGFTPGTIRIDQPTEIGDWAPENYTKRYRGPMTLREALKLSINTIAAQVTSEISPSRVATLATRFGIKTEMRPEYSIALGSSETTLLDMTSAYMVFANEGLSRQPYFVQSITDTAKKTLYTRRTVSPVRTYPVPYARQMTSMLRDVIESGTGHGAQLGSREAAGKTGTTQDYRDAWFLGFTADYTTGVWMGNDDNSPMRKITGGLLPVDAWKSYMMAAHKGVKKKPINAPDPLIEDPRIQQQIAFYEELGTALIAERDIASGAKSAGNAGSTTAGR